MTVGQRIKAKRIEKGLTQSELGARLHCTKSAISKVETDKETNLSIDRISDFADALGCMPSELMGWDMPLDYQITLDDDKTSVLVKNYKQLPTTQKELLLQYARFLANEVNK